ncbi:serine hydrolase [Synechococcus sp. RSCCF101]|uniref:serine hydrolase n=1 Tax=Synechococcus sp. RSCCF101 TaxID=2511069 RepID=UPI0012491EA5|nr:serine hydrolase [Synechococcus sp. RSCCF101]QEY31548.1 serine hydrolase [Synechococcus sp. RSCCF101]
MANLSLRQATPALALIGGLLLAAPGSPARAATPSPTAVSPAADTQALNRALAALPGLISTAMERTGLPGLAVVVVHNDEAVLLQGYGTRRLGSGEPVDADTVFQLASLSKPVASTVIAAAVGDGLIDWDEPVMRWLPELRIGSADVASRVTLRDLLSHRSGLPDHAGDDLEDLGFPRDTILQRLAALDTGNRFRAAYAYTNFGFAAAGEAAARAAGMSWEELSEERLYQPLGLQRTSSRHAAFVAEPNRASLHQRLDGRWQVSEGRQPDAQSPAGGVSASARDLARWMRLHLNGGTLDGRRIVAEAALAESHRPQAISRPPLDSGRDRAGLYGLGWNVTHDGVAPVRLSHSGAFALGAATAVTLIPARGLGIAVLSNGTPMGVPESVIASFLDLVLHGTIRRDYAAAMAPAFAASLEPDYEPVREPAATAELPLERYTGTYRNSYVGDAVVERGPAGLQLRLGPKGRPAPLTAHGGHRFSYQPWGENAGGPSAVRFTIGADGQASRVSIDALDGAGMGTLQRLRSP